MTALEIQKQLIQLKSKFPRDAKWWRHYYKLRSAFYSSTKWKNLRQRVLKKYKSECVLCHKRARDVHHILTIFAYPEYMLDFVNLILLCRSCHKTYHKTHNGLSTVIKT